MRNLLCRALPVVTELVPVPGHPEVERDFQELVQFEAYGVKKMRKLKAWKEKECQPLHVFISYSHKDEQYMERLRIALIPLTRTQEVTVWEDQQIEPGQEWRDEIFENVDRADIFILLLSPTSVASEFVTEKELPHAMERQDDGLCQIMGVVVKPCSKGLDRLKLSDQQVVFYNAKAISQTTHRDAAWDHVVKELERVIDRIHKNREKPDGSI